MDNKEDLKHRLGEYVLKVTTKSRERNKYVCPVCKSGATGNKNSAAFTYEGGDLWYCHSARHQSGGDIFDLYAQIHGLDKVKDFPAIVEGLTAELGDPLPVKHEAQPAKRPKKDNSQIEREIEQYAAALPGSRGEKYLHSRGFSSEVISSFRFGYDEKRDAVVIPYPGESYYAERLLAPNGRDKYKNIPGTMPTFHIIKDAASPYFITEGQFDAIALSLAGAKNVIASHYKNKLSDWFSSVSVSGAVIVADKDPEESRGKDPGALGYGKTPGEINAESVSGMLTEMGVKNMIVYPPKDAHDANDLFKEDPAALSSAVAEWTKEIIASAEDPGDGEQQDKEETDATRIYNVGEYLESAGFDSDIQYFKKYKDRKTGFNNIDEHMRVYPGLACLTGATSLGKTSFCVQMADQLAARGETVLYFSLEQLTVELVTKCLARATFGVDPNSPINNIDIKNGASSPALLEGKKAFMQHAGRLNIIECDFTYTAEKIVKTIESFIEKYDVRPVVFVDYLQIISAPDGARFDERAKIDDAVKRFKALSKNKELFILMISNMARTSYLERIAEDSYKESGLIEFTCDYLFGLQLAILEDDDFFVKTGAKGGEKDALKSEKQLKVEEASRATPKEVVFKAVKNRNGEKVFKAFFHYYPAFDAFIEADAPRSSQFKPLPNSVKTPFDPSIPVI